MIIIKLKGNKMTQELIADILSENLVESTEQFNSILGDKIAVKILEAKIDVAKSLFAQDLSEAGE